MALAGAPLTKQSTISPRNRSDRRPTLFLDATNSSPELSNVLEASGWSVEHHRHHFKDQPDIADHEWIEIIAPKGWVIISCDKNMRSWRTERGKVRPVIERTRAKVFFLSSGGRTMAEYGHAIGLVGKDICRIVKQNARVHSFATIHTRGSRLGHMRVP